MYLWGQGVSYVSHHYVWEIWRQYHFLDIRRITWYSITIKEDNTYGKLQSYMSTLAVVEHCLEECPVWFIPSGSWLSCAVNIPRSTPYLHMLTFCHYVCENDGSREEEEKASSHFAVNFIFRGQTGQGYHCSRGDCRSWRAGDIGRTVLVSVLQNLLSSQVFLTNSNSVSGTAPK